jgi:formylglycine-generating enzyme required for sulfatase activity
MTRRLLLSAFVIVGFGLAWVPAQGESNPAPPAKGTHQSYTEKIPNSSVSFDMIAIPGGRFKMGSPDSEAGRLPDEGPVHEVDIAPFWMAKCEVTWDEYEIFWQLSDPKNDPPPKRKTDSGDAITRPTPTYVEADYGHGHEGHPVVCMSHHNAMEYCRWLSRVTGKSYRLPTEAEWEYAARAGTATAYSFGDDPAKLDDYAWYKNNSPTEEKPRGTTYKVGTKKPNPWGLYDMYGNVAEWCVDHYDSKIYALRKGITLGPVLLPTDKRFSHVVRGGSWADTADRCRSAARRGSDESWIKHDPNEPKSIWWLTKMDVIGFRVVCAVNEQDNLKGLRSKVTKQSD